MIRGEGSNGKRYTIWAIWKEGLRREAGWFNKGRIVLFSPHPKTIFNGHTTTTTTTP